MAAARVCSTCGGAIRGKKKERFFECVRCARWQHNYCVMNWEWDLDDPKLCDICLDQERQQPQQWVEKLASLDFHRICRPYNFCYLCCKHFCPRCCPAVPRCRRRDHGNHRTFLIQVRQHGGGGLLLVRLTRVNWFYNCSRIEPEIAGWVRLHPKPEEQDAGGGGKPCGFRECNRRIAQDYDFCSIYCQFEEIARDAVMPPTRQEVLDSRVQKDRVSGLLRIEGSNGTPIVSLGHRWDKFCLLCHAGFSSQAHPVSELRPNSCLCGSGIDKDMRSCSVHCMADDL